MIVGKKERKAKRKQRLKGISEEFKAKYKRDLRTRYVCQSILWVCDVTEYVLKC